MESQLGHKWEGKASARVTKASADQIWPLLMDFFNLHKWLQHLTDCHGIHGENGQPSCVRYCAGFSLSSGGADGAGENRPINYAQERLVSIDPTGRTLSYDMMDNNVGYTSFLSTVRVIPDAGEGEGGKCTIEWSFSVDPVEGWALEDLVRAYEAGLQGMAKSMEDSFGK